MRAFDTNVMERTEAYALWIIRLYSALPDYPAPGYQVAQTIGKQLLRSGTSVGANFAESTRSQSIAEKVARQHICLREVQETRYWLRLLIKAEIMNEQQVATLLAETDELIALFISSLRRLQA
jgi:four helix bundle protein